MPKFVSKVVTIEAVQFTGSNIDDIIAFCDGNARISEPADLEVMLIGHLDKERCLDKCQFFIGPNTWVIKDADNLLSKCNPHRFMATYSISNG